MKLKFLRDCKYPQNDPSQSRSYKAGEVYEVDADHGQRWINRGAAIEVHEKATAKPEAMVPAPPAKAQLHESIGSIRKAKAESV